MTFDALSESESLAVRACSDRLSPIQIFGLIPGSAEHRVKLYIIVPVDIDVQDPPTFRDEVLQLIAQQPDCQGQGLK